MKTALTTINGNTTYNIALSAPEVATIAGQLLAALLAALLGKTNESLTFACVLMQVKDEQLIRETLLKLQTELIARGHDEDTIKTTIELLTQIYLLRLQHWQLTPEGTNKLT